MQRQLVRMVSLVYLLHIVKAQTEYCAASLCERGLKHIACRNSGRFASACPSNAKMVNLSAAKSMIVNMHNVRRNALANGELPGYQPAAQMATMEWSDELASIAAYNVKQCVMKHDACRNTAEFPNSGQNLGLMRYTGSKDAFANAAIIRQLISSWWDEHEDANMNIMRSYPARRSGRDIGHFTVMAADRNIRVGCAASRFTQRSTHHFLLACNYATTNMIGEPVYLVGRTASACTRGRTNPAFDGLCSTSQIYSDFK